MTADRPDVPAFKDPQSQLERAFIDELLRLRPARSPVEIPPGSDSPRSLLDSALIRQADFQEMSGNPCAETTQRSPCRTTRYVPLEALRLPS